MYRCACVCEIILLLLLAIAIEGRLADLQRVSKSSVGMAGLARPYRPSLYKRR